MIGTPTQVGGTPAAHNATDTVTTWSFSSFTPNVGDVLVVSVEHIFGTGVLSPTTISISNTGFTTGGWTQVSQINSDSSFDLRTSMFYAVVTASAAGVVTITRDAAGSAFWLSYGLMWSFTGVDTSSPVVQSGAANTTAGTTATVTLGATPLSNSCVISSVFDASGGGAGTVSGFTDLADRLEDGDAFCTAYDLTPTSATVQWTGLNSTLSHQQVVLELRASGVENPLLFPNLARRSF